MTRWIHSARVAAAMTVMLMLWGLSARSRPISPDPFRCVEHDPKLSCCPRHTTNEIFDFKPPQPSFPLRIRRPAHALDTIVSDKYAKAVALMRELPDDHPWNFNVQANVHCAYCSGGHLQYGRNISLEIHGSWHFFTWHRAYLYFYERILGKLINDTTFALPFWNWDDPAGMTIPQIYRANSSSLFNPTRFPNALNYTDLGGCEPDSSADDSLEKVKQCNLQVMHRQFAAAFNSSEIFLGKPYRDGDNAFSGSGVLENSPHSPVHLTTSSDMVRIATSARDPLFHSHHANVDRLWAIWSSIPGNGSKVFNDTDFLDASFLFWDENMQLVRIRVRDVVDTHSLGYVYEDVPLLWMNIKMNVEQGENYEGVLATAEGDEEVSVQFPVVLSSIVMLTVAKTSGTSWEKLVVNGIELDGRDYVWFDVHVRKVGGGGGAAGSFFHMGRRGDKKITVATMLQIMISQLMVEIDAAGDDRIVVSLIPKIGGDNVTIGGVLVN